MVTIENFPFLGNMLPWAIVKVLSLHQVILRANTPYQGACLPQLPWLPAVCHGYNQLKHNWHLNWSEEWNAYCCVPWFRCEWVLGDSCGDKSREWPGQRECTGWWRMLYTLIGNLTERLGGGGGGLKPHCPRIGHKQTLWSQKAERTCLWWTRIISEIHAVRQEDPTWPEPHNNHKQRI